MKSIINKTIIIILILLVVFSIIAFVVDRDLANNNRKPIFCIKTSAVNDGGSNIYYGLFYKVIDYNVGNGRKDAEIGTWFMQYDAGDVEDKTLYIRLPMTKYLPESSVNIGYQIDCFTDYDIDLTITADKGSILSHDTVTGETLNSGMVYKRKGTGTIYWHPDDFAKDDDTAVITVEGTNGTDYTKRLIVRISKSDGYYSGAIYQN